MRLGQFNKQPGERESYTVDYADDLTTGDNVISAAATVAPAGLSIEQIFIVDPRVKFFAEGGEDGTTYKVTLVVETADGRVLEDEIMIKVKEL
jgi:hypothetical protein